MTPLAQAAAVAVLALGTGAATVTVMTEDMPDLQVPDGPWRPGTELDGKVFLTTDRILQTDDVLEDELHFANGRLQSAMCQAYCDFGWSEYRTWTEDGVIHFTAVTECPDAPHTVVWYGRVTGDEIRFEGTWTTRRWYWTRQLNVSGEGTAASPVEGAVAG